jgi:hypothetical protein
MNDLHFPGFAAMNERRTSPRRRIFKQGTLAFSSGGSTACTVRNLSSNGARIEIESPVGMPQSFTLVIATDHFMRHCHTVWSSRQRIGVAFDQDKQPSSPQLRRIT